MNQKSSIQLAIGNCQSCQKAWYGKVDYCPYCGKLAIAEAHSLAPVSAKKPPATSRLRLVVGSDHAGSTSEDMLASRRTVVEKVTLKILTVAGEIQQNVSIHNPKLVEEIPHHRSHEDPIQNKLSEAQVICVFKNVGWYFYHMDVDQIVAEKTTSAPFSFEHSLKDCVLPDLLRPDMPHAGESLRLREKKIDCNRTKNADGTPNVSNIPDEFLMPAEVVEPKREKRGWLTGMKLPKTVRVEFTLPLTLGKLKMEWGQLGKPTGVEPVFQFLKDFGIPDEFVELVHDQLEHFRRLE